jgi:iron complex outermembrane recepter protein
MFKRTKLCSGLMLAFGGTIGFGVSPALAQQQLDRVEVTGSSIKRIQSEGSLPVQTLTREDIQRSGATSVVDLLQNLPAVQGSVGQPASVGGETFGFAGVSLRALGEQRTLVLLNGKRMTQFGGQSFTGFAAAVDLNSIPIAAIERVEILTDGASAIYGTDAIAGVVNFITRKNSSEGDVSIGFSRPSGGAKETRISATKGFGDLDKDGFNFLISASADRRTKLNSTQRDFAKSALVKFSENGKSYQINSGSPSPIPANVTIAGELISPFFVENGFCPPNTFKFGARACYFDYVTQLEIYPEQDRKNLFLQGALKLGDSARLTTEFLYGNNQQTSRIAPVPGSIPVAVGSLPPSVRTLPGVPATGNVTARYRVFDLGKRTNENQSDLYHFATTLDGAAFGFDYSASFVHSENKAETSIKGYPEQDAFFALTRSGLINPFVGPGQQSAAGLAAAQATLRDGYYNGGKASLDMISARVSRDLAELSGGPLSLGAGGNFQVEKNNNAPSDLAQGISGVRFGDQAAVVPYSARRKAAGMFAEMVAPVAKTIELSGALRYDKYQGVGDTTNGKLSARWTPVPQFLVRGSVGTGFRAPTVPQVQAPEQQFGVTSNQYDCSTNPALQAVAAGVGGVCRPDGDQYDVFAGGNRQLKPEKSKQASIGMRFEPTAAISLGVDYWGVGIKDSISQLPESEFFDRPALYASKFRTLLDAASGLNYLAIYQGNENLGNAYNTGLDFDVTGRATTDLGRLTSQLTATYMLRNQYQLVKNGEYFSSLGRYGEDTTVTFRFQGRLANTLQVSDAWSHTLAFNFKSGYADSVVTAEVLNAAGVPTGVEEDVVRQVARYYTFDWQTNWKIAKTFTVQAGILNLFNSNPPFSIVTGGLNKGQMRGYDDRYYDPRGRTFYANMSYKF